MASSSDADEPNDVASSDPLTEVTTATKKRSLNSSTGTLISSSFSSTGTLTPPSSSYSIVTLKLPLPPLLPTLPFELIVEILYKLPVKFLMQFKCVCKSWKSLISDPKFAKKHFHISTKHHRLISTSNDDDFIYMDYPLTAIFTEDTAAAAMQLEYPLQNQYCFPIVGSCHGILCIEIDRVTVLLWNPSIRKFTKLPCLEETPGPGCEFCFGYDHFSDSYKVVVCFYNSVVINGERVWKTLVRVHTLGTNSWRTIQDFPSGFLREACSTKFVCGTITWLAFATTDNFPGLPWNIISLDLEKESYQEILQPDYGGLTVTSLKLGVLRDCLCIFSCNRSDTFTDIWLMKEYGNKESWIKLFRVPEMRDLGSNYDMCANALYVSEDDQMLLNVESELVIYNSRDGTFKDLNIPTTNGARGTQVYHESLISPCF